MSLDLDKLAELEASATPGPWQALASEVIDDGGNVAWTAASPEPIADAALIAALRNAAKPLIAAARERATLADSRDRWRTRAKEAGSQVVDLRAATGLGDGLWTTEDSCRAYEARAKGAEVERDAARAEVAALRERVEAVLDDLGQQVRRLYHEDDNPREAGRVAGAIQAVRAALAIGADV